MLPESASVHRHMCNWSRVSKMSPLTTALALQMMEKEDPPLLVIACWWIAIKFEEVEEGLMYASDLLDDLGRVESMQELRMAEATVLWRNDFSIPYRTTTRSLFEMLGREYEAWLHALLYARVISLYAASVWRDMIRRAVEGGCISPVFQVLFHILPRRIRVSLPVSLVCPCLRGGEKEPVLVFTPVEERKKRKASVLDTVPTIDLCAE